MTTEPIQIFEHQVKDLKLVRTTKLAQLFDGDAVVLEVPAVVHLRPECLYQEKDPVVRIKGDGQTLAEVRCDQLIQAQEVKTDLDRILCGH